MLSDSKCSLINLANFEKEVSEHFDKNNQCIGIFETHFLKKEETLSAFGEDVVVFNLIPTSPGILLLVFFYTADRRSIYPISSIKEIHNKVDQILREDYHLDKALRDEYLLDKNVRETQRDGNDLSKIQFCQLKKHYQIFKNENSGLSAYVNRTCLAENTKTLNQKMIEQELEEEVIRELIFKYKLNPF